MFIFYHILFTALHGAQFFLLGYLLYRIYKRKASKVSLNLSLAAVGIALSFFISSASYLFLPGGNFFLAKFLNVGSELFGYLGLSFAARVVIIQRVPNISARWAYLILGLGFWATSLDFIFYDPPSLNQYGIVDWHTNFLADFIYFASAFLIVILLAFSLLLPNLSSAQTRSRAIFMSLGILIGAVFVSVAPLGSDPQTFLFSRIVAAIGLGMVAVPLAFPSKSQ